jgi:excisionase family DNA binding protein
MLKKNRPNESISEVPLWERPTLTINEFCKLVGIGRSTFYKALAAGDIRPRRYRGKNLITKEEVKRFIASLPAAPGGPAQPEEPQNSGRDIDRTLAIGNFRKRLKPLSNPQ